MARKTSDTMRLSKSGATKWMSAGVMRMLGIGLLTGLCWSVAPVQASAQYSPEGRLFEPVFSPYLSMFRQDPGPLPNYFQFVRPQQSAIESIQSQQRAFRRQQRAFGPGGSASAAPGELLVAPQPTGAGGTFMNHSHFYPGLSQQRVSR